MKPITFSANIPPPKITPCAYWKVEQGYFCPVSLQNTSYIQELQALTSLLSLPETVRIYARGSRVEHESHHPFADLDLIILSPRDTKKSDLIALYDWFKKSSIPIDIRKCISSEIHLDAHLHLLIATRSVHIKGIKLMLEPVPANIETMRCIFHQYAFYRLPPILTSHHNLRLLELKLLTRSFGCIGFLQGSPFTRDIAACIEVAKADNEHIGHLLESFWIQFCQNRPLPTFHILPIIKRLMVLEQQLKL